MIDLEDMRREGREAAGLACGHYCIRAADEIDRLRAENGRLRTAFRVNMLRAGHSDAEINSVLANEQTEQSGRPPEEAEQSPMHGAGVPKPSRHSYLEKR